MQPMDGGGAPVNPKKGCLDRPVAWDGTYDKNTLRGQGLKKYSAIMGAGTRRKAMAHARKLWAWVQQAPNSNFTWRDSMGIQTTMTRYNLYRKTVGVALTQIGLAGYGHANFRAQVGIKTYAEAYQYSRGMA